MIEILSAAPQTLHPKESAFNILDHSDQSSNFEHADFDELKIIRKQLDKSDSCIDQRLHKLLFMLGHPQDGESEQQSHPQCKLVEQQLNVQNSYREQ